MTRKKLFGLTLSELQCIISEAGLPKFAAKQMCDWLYKKNAQSIDEMTNLSKIAREKLSTKYEVGQTSPMHFVESIDGTKKYLFKVQNGYIETAYIPDGERATLCVSCQVGCKMGCTFCMTGRMGFKANITSGEILNQIASIQEFSKLTNIVFMGMGEPMDNLNEVLKAIEILTSDWGYAWSPRRITVSTIGVMPQTERFLKECQAHLAISLHNAISSQRSTIMPSEKKWPIEQTVNILRKYDWSGQRKLTFEYTLILGVNDSNEHIKAITTLLNGMRCHINIIPLNTASSEDNILTTEKNHYTRCLENFRDRLNAKGFTATVRNSRGSDIDAACGLLSTKQLSQNHEN